MKVQTVALDSLTPDPVNARKHDRRNLEAIMESLTQFGQRKPIVVTAAGLVLAGNGTLAAARELGWESIDVTRTPADWDDDRARAFALADNKTAELATWDQDILGAQLVSLEEAGWDVNRLGFGGTTVKLAPADADETDATPPAIPHSALGDVWILGRHRVVCGDSTDVGVHDLVMVGEKADMVWTDPPYGINLGEPDVARARARKLRTDGKRIENDDISPEQLSDFLRASLGAAFAASRPGASWYVAAPQGSNLFTRFAIVLEDLEVWRHTLIWVKDQFVLGRADYHYRHEPIFYGWVPGAAHTWHGGRTQDSVLEISRPKRSADHPTMKPVELVVRCITNSCDPEAIVLDPFGGSGTTLLAAESSGRQARLIELDPRYVDVICRRYQEATGTVPILEATGQPHNFLTEADAAARPA